MRSIFFVSLLSPFLAFAQLQEVTEFGPNPGNLRFFIREPPAAQTNVPLVIVLHGCQQSSYIVAKHSGWNKLADKFGFAVMYPMQRVLNNPSRCFNWFRKNDITKGEGEVGSIIQMVGYMEKHYRTNPDRVYVTGHSAGAAMAVALTATYPGIIKGCASYAGGPYNTGLDALAALSAMNKGLDKQPTEWAAMVMEQNPHFTGPWPRLSIVHGEKDMVVDPGNASALVDQWTALHGISNKETNRTDSLDGNSAITLHEYHNAKGEPVVRWYSIKDLGHKLPVNPGEGAKEGGTIGLFARDIDFFGTWYTARDLGLLVLPK